ncbi:sporulation integral membrane protein YlbJ [Desmospora profundinema]|uniref:Sporulation integral membrane protein YlbJ n=1 Tax=Desmospora profundinema TaxID=1571184 RepID=A0ABU1IST3_9BACL|nr:sporulation integral membrane protein YlbJ [Desmospora profundinema]MDR6227259.1 sporulation integral membrane protein YlbJ [Desmospora profundinema]
MRPANPALQPRIRSALLGAVALFLVLSLIFFPEQAFQSSLKGLKIWWDVVFPALLPFFIASEILMGFGVVHFLGVLLEPLMRPLFRVPGTGGFVMAMGLASGYPIGAKLTTRLREQELITRSEGERLVSFTNTADPLFMFGAVAVGFFHDVSLGVAIAVAHYISSLLVGILMRFHEPDGAVTPIAPPDQTFFLMRAFRAMHQARLADGRTLGQLMGDAITSSMNTIMLVGGFIIMFSVIIAVLDSVGFLTLLAAVIGWILNLLQFPAQLAPAVISGAFEITLGAQITSESPASIHMAYKIAVVGAITAWSGLSVHAQVASLLSRTDIRYGPYCAARVMHGFLAGWITLLTWEPINRFWFSSETAVPAFLQQLSEAESFAAWDGIRLIATLAALFLGILLAFSILIHLLRHLRLKSTP